MTLVVGLATDLDQRLLPDVLTLPVIPIALALRRQRAEPARRRRTLVPAILAAVAHPARALPALDPVRGRRVRDRRRQAAGRGGADDRRRAAARRRRSFGLLLAGVVLLVLLLTRRIGRRTYVPFGPFLIVGALWAVLIRLDPSGWRRRSGSTPGTIVRLGCARVVG